MNHHFRAPSSSNVLIRRTIFFLVIAVSLTALVWPFSPILGGRASSGPTLLAGTGTISANPNPIMVCDGSGLGSTTLTWSSAGASNVEVRLGSPAGALVATGPNGKLVTGKSVSNGTVYYLQDSVAKSSVTLATVTVGVTTAGCPPPVTPTPTPPPLTQTPFHGPHVVPGITQAEDFDDGGEGVAYHDQDVGNGFGQFYRTTDVDILSDSVASGGAEVANARSGEWLEYTVNVNATGSYDLVARVASDGAGGTFHYVIDPDSSSPITTAQLTAPNTFGWSNYQNAPAARVSLTLGTHIIRVSLDQNGTQAFQAIANFDYFNIVTAGTTRTGSITASPNPIQVCDGSGLGITTLSWTSTGTTTVEVHVGSPSGDLFAHTGPSSSWTTGKWVANGTVFYLQDVSNQLPLTAANTLATVTVGVITTGCGQPPSYEGWHDGSDCTHIFGWAADRNRLSTSISVDIFDGTTLLATVLANQLRQDVGNYLNDNGLHGFDFAVPAALKNGQPHSILVRFAGTSTNLATTPQVINCGAPPPPTGFSAAMVDPFNRTGAPGEDLFSGNYNWSLPLVGLSGRTGLDLGVSLTYNSLVWTKSGSSIKFDADSGFPAPGFRLGFSVIQTQTYTSQAGVPAYLMITPSGSRVELRSVGNNNYESADSSYIQFNDSSRLLRTSDGSVLSYQPSGSYFVCTEIKDRNGNFIGPISYDGLGHITQIKDTLGRLINFEYDASSNLRRIWQVWNGAQHDWATFSYIPLTLAPSFSAQLQAIYPPGLNVLSRVTLTDGSDFSFDYTSFGQVKQITHHAADASHHLLGYTAYNMSTGAAQSDCPRFTTRTDSAPDWDTVTTSFVFDRGSGSGQATMPDGTLVKEYHDASGFKKGLTTKTETYSSDNFSTPKRTVTLGWEQDTASTFPTNPRVNDTLVTDDALNKRRTSITFTTFGLPSDVTEYNADAVTPLRKTHTDYNLDSTFTSRRIIGLTSAVLVCDGTGGTSACGSFGTTLFSKVSYIYDDTALTGTSPATIQHDNTNYGVNFNAGRGNLTKTRRYDVSAPTEIYVETRIAYNTNGSPLSTTDPAFHSKSVRYDDSFSDTGNLGTFAYPTTVTDGDGFSTTIKYSYPMGVVKRTHDPKSAEIAFDYDTVGRLAQRTYFDALPAIPVQGSYTRFVYVPDSNRIESYTLLDRDAFGNPTEAFSAQIFDGVGRVRAKYKDLPTAGSGHYSAQLFFFDKMGRLKQQSNSTEITAPGGNWIPSGDDAGVDWMNVGIKQTYDWKGRPRTTTNQDGTVRTMSYGGCGCAGGEVVTRTDEVGRVQKAYHDVLGRVVKIEDLKPNAAVYRTAANTYNARDQITSSTIRIGAAGAIEETTMTYDGQGRLRTQKLPIQTSPTTYDYNADDTIQVVTDPRGVTANYTYNNRHLVTNISYVAPPNVPPTGSVIFLYDAAGNRTRMGDDSGRRDYVYDTWSRLSSETKRFTGLGGAFAINYEYNLAGELKKVTDPFGMAVNYAYDQAGQLQSVSSSPYAGVTQYASNMQYRAWGGLKHLDYGNNPRQLSLTYNSRLQTATMRIHNAGPDLGSWQYSYSGDGHVSSSHDVVNSLWDRSYSYDDPVGRLTETFSGSYFESFAHDVWNNMTNRNGGIAGSSFSYTTTYTNDRDQNFQYDFAGNLTRDDHNSNYTYDAAGRLVALSFRAKSWVYDNNGSITKWVQGGITTYNVGSSLLGRVINELDASGNKRRTYIYAGDQLLATQQFNQVRWQHEDASGTSISQSGSDGSLLDRTEADPFGVKANVELPENNPEPIFRVPANNPSTGCMLDGVDAPCSIALSILERGAGQIDSLHGDLDRAMKRAQLQGEVDILQQILHPDASRGFDLFGSKGFLGMDSPGFVGIGWGTPSDQLTSGDTVDCVMIDGQLVCSGGAFDSPFHIKSVPAYSDDDWRLLMLLQSISDHNYWRQAITTMKENRPGTAAHLRGEWARRQREQQRGFDQCVSAANSIRIEEGLVGGIESMTSAAALGGGTSLLGEIKGAQAALGQALGLGALDRVVTSTSTDPSTRLFSLTSGMEDLFGSDVNYQHRLKHCVAKYPFAFHGNAVP